jgi:tyrosine-protein phosphatase SIW14
MNPLKVVFLGIEVCLYNFREEFAMKVGVQLNRSFFRLLMALFLATTDCFSLLKAGDLNASPLPNLAVVEDGLYRSGRPSKQGLIDLKQNDKLAIILNLEHKKDSVSKEKGWAKDLKIKFINIPLDADVTPTDEAINKALKTIEERDSKSLLVHCFHGQDRTGLLVGLYRVENEGWDPQDAYQEMIDHGYHCAYKALDDYFRKRTARFGSVKKCDATSLTSVPSK